MLSSIHPLGERGRNSRYPLTVIAYVLGTSLGGVMVGTLSGSIGGALTSVVTLNDEALAAAVLGIVLLGLVLDAGPTKVPSYRRQVNEDWLNRYRGWVYGGGFGFQLGLAFVTIVPSASIYATFLLAVLSGSVATGALVGLIFGLARSAMILTMVGVDSPDALRSAHQRLAEAAPAAHRVAVGAQVLVALSMVGVLAWL